MNSSSFHHLSVFRVLYCISYLCHFMHNALNTWMFCPGVSSSLVFISSSENAHEQHCLIPDRALRSSISATRTFIFRLSREKSLKSHLSIQLCINEIGKNRQLSISQRLPVHWGCLLQTSSVKYFSYEQHSLHSKDDVCLLYFYYCQPISWKD